MILARFFRSTTSSATKNEPSVSCCCCCLCMMNIKRFVVVQAPTASALCRRPHVAHQISAQVWAVRENTERNRQKKTSGCKMSAWGLLTTNKQAAAAAAACCLSAISVGNISSLLLNVETIEQFIIIAPAARRLSLYSFTLLDLCYEKHWTWTTLLLLSVCVCWCCACKSRSLCKHQTGVCLKQQQQQLEQSRQAKRARFRFEKLIKPQSIMTQTSARLLSLSVFVRSLACFLLLPHTRLTQIIKPTLWLNRGHFEHQQLLHHDD